ncbi:hypothetical protein [Gelidibacter maritimus]|uniref:Selenophosphate synthetase n=1 Tax=Gelidibacter maritimus TaxID=2761487 RepID=A0A7W2R440_9FLAO|nr:hypothetical protein [Gelidibacter maritimus]MBA6153313.1 hypothetical protein [Gelidibacter maritimus]
MKKTLIIVTVFVCFFSCKQKVETKSNEKEWSTAEKIANANGFENWKDVSEIQFTFNVDRDTTHFERSWTWHPKSDDVMMVLGKDTVAYNRKSMDSISLNADKAFINDKYWLLAPFQLVWDTSASISESSVVESPISKAQLNKITITYSDDGGYTPGDAYDLFFDEDFILKEWVYRKGNSQEPSMMTTWENYEDFNGIKIAKTHKRPNEDWTLHFTDIKIVK